MVLAWALSKTRRLDAGEQLLKDLELLLDSRPSAARSIPARTTEGTRLPGAALARPATLDDLNLMAVT